ncbi:MAG TPA: hypothetical protein DDZ60_10340 [Planktothrix sp. UBA10369]|jgi:hypothetical protein|nr:hypothetical protein [Planktothrix sp. UBA8402]HBK22874.1 hypothetical protein [Planktothrix sp. UBA10369]
MTYLRLNSVRAKQSFVIRLHSLIGYCESEINQEITLYTSSYHVSLSKDNTWDNWDEFVEQVKANFVDTEDF